MKCFVVYTFTFSLCFLVHIASAQDKKSGRFGFQVSYGNSLYIQNFSDGAPSYDGKFFFDIGFLYLKPLSDKWEFETGLVFSSNKFKVTPNLPPQFSREPYNVQINNWVIPANFRMWLPKRFFLQAGPNLSQSIDNSFGFFRLGFSLGVGKEFKLGDKHALLIAPTFNATPFFPTNSEGIMQLGIRSIFAIPTKK